MINERVMGLMQRAVDGEASDSERAEISETTRDSAEASTTYEELKALVEELESQPLAAAPDLKPEVLSRIRGSMDRGAGQTRSRVTILRYQRKRQMARLYAVAALIVLAISLYPILKSQTSPIDSSQAAGTMAPLQVNEWPVTNRARSGLSTLTVRRKGDQLAVEVKVDKSGGVVSIPLDPGQLRVVALPRGAGNGRPAVRSGGIEYSNPAEGRSTFVFRKLHPTETAKIIVLVDGKELLHTSVN